MSKGKDIDLKTAGITAKKVVDFIKEKTGVELIVAGSIRRQRPVVHDIDFVCTDTDWLKVAKFLPDVLDECYYKKKDGTLAGGNLDGIDCEFYYGPERGIGALIQFATGSGDFNIYVRRKAIGSGLKVSQYGVFDRITNEFLGGKTEEELFKIVGMQFVEPTQREV